MSVPFLAELEERFLRYAKIDTKADPTSSTSPSTQIQFDLLNLLVDELKEIGAQDVTLTDYGAVLATIPATVDDPCPPSRFWRMWTPPRSSPARTSSRSSTAATTARTSCCPTIRSRCCRPRRCLIWRRKVGDDIVTATGTTLLGADDKAGVAIVMAAARHLLQNPDLPHGTIRIGFTPDEEIGRGVHRQPAGRPEGRLRLHARRRAPGRDRLRDLFGGQGDGERQGRVDPSGLGQGQAGQRAAPGRQDRRHAAPRHADAGDHRRPRGFIHIVGMSGSAAEMTIDIILRDFERDGLAAHGELLQKVCAAVQAGEPRARSPAPSRPSIATCATGWRTTCARSNWRGEACRQIGRRTVLRTRPRRHRRLAPDRAGRADAEPLHRDAGHPRAAGMGQRAETWRPRPRCASSWCSYGRQAGRAEAKPYAVSRRPSRWWTGPAEGVRHP